MVTLPARIAGLAQRASNSPSAALILAFVLATLVAALDSATGYELRLAVLYLIPISLATWVGGWKGGMPMVSLSGLFWLLSFASSHPYSGTFFFYWEGVVMITVYLAFVLLLTRLRGTLNRADERFLRVLEELHSAVFVTDPANGKVLYANQSLARLINADPMALGSKELSMQLGLGDIVGEGARYAQDESGDSGFDSREVRNPASGRWYLVRIGQIPWESSRMVNLQMITDISAQKRARAMKQQHQDILHETARLAALAEISSSLAHEVNQPLMAIASYNDACLRMLEADTYDKNDLVTALQRGREQAHRAGKVIGRVREFIRSRRPSATHFDINALAREALDLLETQLENGAVATELSLSDAPLMVHADRTLLLQVVVNLVQNAIDAMSATEPSQKMLRLSTCRDDDGAIVVSVSDHGEGIPDYIGEQPYTPLYTTKSQGMGLGLSICRSVVEAHGGRIWHSANPEGGCTFHFTLPGEIE